MRNRWIESDLFEALSSVTDMILINVLFIILSIPLFFYGAAKTAMYELMLRMVEKNGISVREFFTRFGNNFKKGIVPGLLFALWNITATVCGFLCVNGLLSRMGFPDEGETIALICAVVSILFCNAVKEKYFLFAARFEGPFKQHFSNAIRYCLGYSIRSLLTAILASVPVLCLLFNPVILSRIIFLILLLYYAAVALAEAYLMKKPIMELIVRFNQNETEDQ